MTDAGPKMTMHEAGGLPCGAQVEVVSWSGRRYQLTFLAEMPEAWIVRLPDQRLARLFADQVDWGTLRRLDRPAAPPLHRGDELLLELSEESIRGYLQGISCAGLDLRIGRRIRQVSRDTLLGAVLLFPANELQASDPFLIRSRAGIAYEGWVTSAPHNDQIPVEFTSGSRCTLRWSRLDPSSLRLKVPIPDGAQVACGSHAAWRPLHAA